MFLYLTVPVQAAARSTGRTPQGGLSVTFMAASLHTLCSCPRQIQRALLFCREDENHPTLPFCAHVKLLQGPGGFSGPAKLTRLPAPN